jgi:hypothetical protein
MSESSHVNLNFSGLEIHEKKIFKRPNSIFALLWLSPFENDLALPLNKLYFPSGKKCLYQV